MFCLTAGAGYTDSQGQTLESPGVGEKQPDVYQFAPPIRQCQCLAISACQVRGRQTRNTPVPALVAYAAGCCCAVLRGAGAPRRVARPEVPPGQAWGRRKVPPPSPAPAVV